MASAKFEGGKYHGATEAKAHMRHDDITPEARAVAAINNPHIDVTKSHLNKSLLGLTYEQMCEKYDNRIAQLDNTTNRNKRKDRVTLQNIEVPVPAGLDKKLYNKWFCRVGEILCDAYGRDNLIDAQIHYDEEHEYIDAETHEKKMSRVHMHASIVPEVQGQLNCKRMSGRANMRKLNNAIEKMTEREFGCKFMDGSKKKSDRTMDELKNSSAKLKAEQENKQLQRENEQLRHDNELQEAALNAAYEVRMTKIKRREEKVEDDEKRIEAYKADAVKDLEAQRQQTLHDVQGLYDKALALHNKLLRMSDAYLKYAQTYGNELGSLKRQIDGLSL